MTQTNHRVLGILGLTAAILLFLFVSVCSAAEYVYVLAAPYNTVTDNISLEEIRGAWQGEIPEHFQKLIMDSQTRQQLSGLWGTPAFPSAIRTVSADRLLTYAWSREDCWAILPFEQLDARWKVIDVDGTSPFTRGFDPAAYGLSLPLPEGEQSNFDPDHLTTLTMTGTTAMARNLAYHIETDGLLVPVKNISETLAASDITHISNESSFTPDCPPGNPLRPEQRFCSAPSYFALLEAVGADVIELTGNHNVDYGYESFLYSMDLYESAGMKTYGGGLTPEKAQEPLLVEHNGNKLAFLGCNAIGPETVFATEYNPGAAPCDLPKMKQQIAELKAEGWLPIVTFQHLEWVDHTVPSLQSHDFYEIARDAAPVIISGSQAHIAQGMTFVGKTFIHFGLGNLLFDQMSEIERKSFFDRHYFYENRYLGNRLETIILENYSQPRFLDPAEREAFLKEIFDTCTWNELFTEEHE